MKIADIEAKLEQGDCSEEILDQFKQALNRVPKQSRCQHCYTTAAAMPLRFSEQAISLIRYGLTEHSHDWLDRMRSHHNMAAILEATGDYAGAKAAYAEALAAVDSARRSDYEPEYASHLLRTELHISCFTYTEELEKHYRMAVRADAFSLAFQRKRFYCLLAEILIRSRHEDREGALAAMLAAKEMLGPGFMGPVAGLLKRKGIIEDSGATREARAFLRRAEDLCGTKKKCRFLRNNA